MNMRFVLHIEGAFKSFFDNGFSSFACETMLHAMRATTAYAQVKKKQAKGGIYWYAGGARAGVTAAGAATSG